MQELTELLQSSADLQPADIERAVSLLTAADVADSEKADFLKALRAKGETAAEIAGFAKALLSRAVDPGIVPERLSGPMLDVCGTGGDKMELFNVSTTSMFVLAAGGVSIVKHGNRAITSKCGGADVLEALGARIDLPPAELRRCVETLGVGFIFAPAFHPAFKMIVPVRKLLAAQGIPTVFNILGPLLNPSRPSFQLVGLFSRTLLAKYAATLAALGRTRAWAVHGDGSDELAITGSSEIHDVTAGCVSVFNLTPEELGLTRPHIGELKGGDCAENARILVAILDGSDRGARRDIVMLNAAAGFVVSGLAADLPAGLELAREQIESGRALAKLGALQSFAA